MMRRALFAGVLMVITGVSAFSKPLWAKPKQPPAATPQSIADEADKLFSGGRYAEALNLFQTLYDQYKAPLALYMTGRCHQELGELEAARNIFVLFLKGRVAAEARARAQANLAKLDPLLASLQRADQQLQAGNFGEALDLYRSVFDQAKVPKAQYQMSRCLQELGEWQAALDTLNSFLQGRVTPEMKAEAELRRQHIQAELDSRRPGQMVLKITPDGAEVFLDDHPIGTSPLAPVSLPPGTYTLLVRAPDRNDSKRQITITPGIATELSISLPAVIAPVKGNHGQTHGITKTAQRRSFSPWTWVTLGAGAAMLVSGTVAYALGESDHRQITAAQGKADDHPIDMTRKEALDLEARGDQRKAVGYSFFGLGGATMTASIVLFVLESVLPPKPAVSVHVTPLRDGVFGGLQGSW